ncbi:hypothetical protein B7463_g9206, partial [Scytalidium lignicola]
MVGESSYGRSFQMAQAGCTGPECLFTGTNATSDGTTWSCTVTGGYLANAEIIRLSLIRLTWSQYDLTKKRPLTILPIMVPFVFSITWQPTLNYQLPSLITPKIPAPSDIPDNDNGPIPTPDSGVNDCTGYDYTGGPDFATDDCSRSIQPGGTPPLTPRPICLSGCPILTPYPDGVPHSMSPVMSTSPPSRMPTAKDCTSFMTAEACTEIIISSTAVVTSPTTSWSTTTRTRCVHGSRNPHEAFVDTDLDFFVCTSLTSGISGTPGQANYAAGNSSLDCFARHRVISCKRAASLSFLWLMVMISAELQN